MGARKVVGWGTGVLWRVKGGESNASSFDGANGKDQYLSMKVVQAKPLGDHRLHLRFENGREGEVDLSSWVGQGVFSAWRKPEVFAQVNITPEGAVAWPGGIDVCPDSLYLKMTGQTAETLFPALSNPLVHA